MLRILAKKEIDISGLAREMGISVPVAAKYCKILEEKGTGARSTSLFFGLFP
jgi:predicted transcriptional regulator